MPRKATGRPPASKRHKDPTPEQKADAKRLSELWRDYQRENPASTQEWLGEQCGGITQGAVNQFLTGKVPLNLLKLLEFSTALRVGPEHISPKLAKRLEPFRNGPPIYSPEALKIAAKLDALKGEDRVRALEILGVFANRPRTEETNRPLDTSTESRSRDVVRKTPAVQR